MSQLILLSVPLGNKDDVTLRVLKSLEKESYFAVEDTRVFVEWLHRFGLTPQNKEIFSFHEHSPEKTYQKILDLLALGHNVCLVSDAGSPMISDPAYPLLQRLLTAGISITTCPGASSPIAALELSGFPPNPFHFYGFFPRDHKKQKDLLALLEFIQGTFIFFEAPHRLSETLETLSKLIPSHEMAVVREISKPFESVYRFKGKDFFTIKDQIVYKGEIVFLISNPTPRINITNWNDLTLLAHELLEKGATPKRLSKILALILNEKSSTLYTKLIKS